MAARRGVSNLNAEDLGFSGKVECDISHINLYDHQGLKSYYARKIQGCEYKYCWAKNGFVHLRKTDISTTVKLSRLEALQGVASQS